MDTNKALTAKEFAEKYVGRRVSCIDGRNVKMGEGIIFGYSSEDWILIKGQGNRTLKEVMNSSIKSIMGTVTYLLEINDDDMCNGWLVSALSLIEEPSATKEEIDYLINTLEL